MTEDTYRGSASDPLSLNLYSYVMNNSLMYWDPSGHAAQSSYEKGQQQVAEQVSSDISTSSFNDKISSQYQEYQRAVKDGNMEEAELYRGRIDAMEKMLQDRATKANGGQERDITEVLAEQFIEAMASGNKYVSQGYAMGVYQSYVGYTKSSNNVASENVIKYAYASASLIPLSAKIGTDSMVATYGIVNNKNIMDIKTNIQKTTDDNSFLDWIQSKWNQFGEWSENTTTELQIETAKRRLKLKGIDENTPEYIQMLIDNILEDDKMQKLIIDTIIGLEGGIKTIRANEGEKVLSLIKNDKRLINAAAEMGKNEIIQKETNELILKLLDGNINPGKGTKNLFKDIFYLRGDNGARVFYRNSQEGIEILAKASKANEEKVISILRKLYK